MAKCELVRPEPVPEKLVLELSRDEARLVFSLVGSVAENSHAEEVYCALRNHISATELLALNGKVCVLGSQPVAGPLFNIKVKK